MSGSIIIGGKHHRCRVPVLGWHATGFHFAGLPMLDRIDFATVHWNGGEGTAKDVYETLRTRRDKNTGALLGLSAHFYVDHLGRAYQMADVRARCAHAGKRGNKRGPGIEIQNRGLGDKPLRGILRPMLKDRIHGRDVVYAAFLPRQTDTVLALLETICEAEGLPMAVPMNGANVIADVVPDDFLDTFKGIVGHLNLEPGKVDPGLALLRAIAARGMGLRGKRYGTGDDAFENAE